MPILATQHDDSERGANGIPLRLLMNAKALENIKEYELDIPEIEPFADGSHGYVFSGTWRGMPIVQKRYIDDSLDDREMNYREATILSRCACANIIKIYGAGPDIHNGILKYIILEPAYNSSLLELIADLKKKYTIWHFSRWGLQIASALNYLHSEELIACMHRDVKPGNIVLFDGCRIAKLTDFGSAKDVDGADMVHTIDQGTNYYQLIPGPHKNQYSLEIDIAMYSMTLCQILVRPTTSRDKLVFRRCPIPNCPPMLKSMLQRGRSAQPKERPTAQQFFKFFEYIIRQISPLNYSQCFIDFQSRSNTFYDPKRPWSRTSQTFESVNNPILPKPPSEHTIHLVQEFVRKGPTVPITNSFLLLSHSKAVISNNAHQSPVIQITPPQTPDIHNNESTNSSQFGHKLRKRSRSGQRKRPTNFGHSKSNINDNNSGLSVPMMHKEQKKKTFEHLLKVPEKLSNIAHSKSADYTQPPTGSRSPMPAPVGHCPPSAGNKSPMTAPKLPPRDYKLEASFTHSPNESRSHTPEPKLTDN